MNSIRYIVSYYSPDYGFRKCMTFKRESDARAMAKEKIGDGRSNVKLVKETTTVTITPINI
jgi:hypothetical protein